MDSNESIGGEALKIDRQKVALAMARACMDTAALQRTAQIPRPTVNNAIAGRGVRPATLGRIAKALGVDPADIVEMEE